MATVYEMPIRPRPLPGRKYDRLFFFSMVLFILATVVAGFGPTYFFTGGPSTHLPSPIIHLHALVYTAWLLLLLVQSGLISVRLVKLHRSLGLAGFGLAVMLPIAGFLAMASQLHFRADRGDRILTFSAVSFEGIFVFTVLAALAYATRTRDPAGHKRYILLATLGILDAAIFRLPIPGIGNNLQGTFLAVDALVVLIAAYDLWALHKIHRATLFGGLFLIVAEQLTMPLGATPLWHSFARTLQSWNF